MLIGPAALARLAAKKVAVFGVGGVGSFVVEGLARSGVGRLALVDGDVVCLTNLNRQLHATMETIGQPKAAVMRDRVRAINPEAEVTVHQAFYGPKTAAELFPDDCDYIVDAVDTVAAKVDLAVRAWERGVSIISSMGTGNKLDPTKFEVADIYSTAVCPLARVMRHELKKRGVPALKVVYSRERPLPPRAAECAEGMDESSVRRPVPGSVAFVPSVAGMILAAEVVKDLMRE